MIGTTIISSQEVGAQLQTTILVDPPVLTTGSGTFSVNVSIANVYLLQAWQFYLSWNPTILEITDIQEGPFLSLGKSNMTYFADMVNNTDGYVAAADARFGLALNDPATGNGTLASITFQVKMFGKSNLHLYNTILLHPYGGEISHVTEDGFVKCGLAIATFIYSPLQQYVCCPITFDASESSAAPGGFITGFLWDFGDGNLTNTTVSLITHSYATAGEFNATLTVIDNYGNTDKDSQLVSVLQDNTPPMTLDNYDELWHTADFSIILSATDAQSGVAATFFRVNGGTIVRLDVSGQPYITMESANNTLEYWSVDNSGNQETHHLLTGIKLDKTKPAGIIMINNEAQYTTSRDVSLNLSATDELSGVSGMRLSNDDIFDIQPWETFSSVQTWTLSPGDGNKTVYVQFEDVAGLVSDTYSASIILDMTAPLIGPPSLGSVNVLLGQTPAVSVSVTDVTSGIKNVTLFYSLDNGSTWGNPILMYYNVSTGLYDAAIPAQAFGTQVSFKVVAYDNAGNLASRSGTPYFVMMPTSLSVSTSVSSTFAGFAVGINGTLSDFYGTSLKNEPVLISYIFPGASMWSQISSSMTDDNGYYYIQWIPSATGSFTIKAEWAGNSTHVGVSSNVTLSSLPYMNQYVFSVESNSTISSFAFNTTSSELSFTASGPSGTTGYVKVTVAKSLVADATSIKVYLDNNQTSYSIESAGDSWLLTFNYTHSTHKVRVDLNTIVVPEFPSAMIWSLLLMISLLAITAAKMFKRKAKLNSKDPFSLSRSLASLSN